MCRKPYPRARVRAMLSAIDGRWGGPYGPPPNGAAVLPREQARWGNPCRNPAMPLNDLVAPQAIMPALKVNNKKQALHELAARAADLTGRGEREIFDVLMQREKLGSTGVGSGIA